ncbi:MAG: hypothetical protein KA716_32015 [Gloeotrichia echinulata DEX184]|jgi:hypothetical protein|nr:hypothetical protein [Gloeotrichia echinulata DEX184]
MAHRVIDPWTKGQIFLGCAVAFWLIALAPVGKLGKGVFLSLGLCSAVQLVRTSKPLILQEAMATPAAGIANAEAVMQKEITKTELALRTAQAEEELQRLYTNEPTYPVEVVEELREALEHLYTEDAAPRDEKLSTSESADLTEMRWLRPPQASLYLAVQALFTVGKSETFIIEEVLKMGGKRWAEGKEMLRSLLELGEAEGW